MIGRLVEYYGFGAWLYLARLNEAPFITSLMFEIIRAHRNGDPDPSEALKRRKQKKGKVSES